MQEILNLTSRYQQKLYKNVILSVKRCVFVGSCNRCKEYYANLGKSIKIISKQNLKPCKACNNFKIQAKLPE